MGQMTTLRVWLRTGPWWRWLVIWLALSPLALAVTVGIAAAGSALDLHYGVLFALGSVVCAPWLARLSWRRAKAKPDARWILHPGILTTFGFFAGLFAGPILAGIAAGALLLIAMPAVLALMLFQGFHSW